MRKALLRHAPILTVALLLGGCVHAVDLVPLDGGLPGLGDVAFKGKAMTVRLDGRTYSGAFVPASAPEVVAGMTPPPGAAMSGSRTWGVQGSRGATGAILTAKDGAKIACRFTYEAADSIGSGLCRGQDGRNFALRMR